MSTSHRPTLLLSALVLITFGSIFFGSPALAQQAGVYVTRSGYRVPVYGVSAALDAEGRVGTACNRLTAPQVDALRITRSISRSLIASYPRTIVRAAAGATFEIVYTDPEGTGFSDPAQGSIRKRAMEATVAAWSAVIQGTVPIVVQARMEAPKDPESSTLASAAPVDFYSVNGRLLPSALTFQLQGSRSADSAVDIEVVINPTVDWDYTANGQAAPGRYSFVYTMMHEVGHGLGFLSTLEIESGALLNELPTPFDVFVNRGSSSSNPLTLRSSGQVKEDLVSNDLFFSGRKAAEASARSIRPLPMVKLFAPNPYEKGSSTSHVDQDTYANFKVGLMTPKDFSSGTDKVDILTLGILEDLGYQLVPGAVTAGVPRR